MIDANSVSAVAALLSFIFLVMAILPCVAAEPFRLFLSYSAQGLEFIISLPSFHFVAQAREIGSGDRATSERIQNEIMPHSRHGRVGLRHHGARPGAGGSPGP